jgi:hypothetical protein
MNPRVFFVGALIALGLTAPVAASAHSRHAYGGTDAASYGKSGQNSGEEGGYRDSDVETTGTITSVGAGNFTLSNGDTVALNDETAIAPQVTQLAPGMNVRVTGRSTGRKRIEADTVTVKSGSMQPYLDGGN